MTKDMTQREFDKATAKHGLRGEGIMGYYAFDLPGGGQCCISKLNAGDNRREQLAYLLREKDKAIAKAEATQTEQAPQA